jgi:hypothetical protein
MVLPDGSSEITVGVGRGPSSTAEYCPVQAFIPAAGVTSARLSNKPITNSTRDALISRPIQTSECTAHGARHCHARFSWQRVCQRHRLDYAKSARNSWWVDAGTVRATASLTVLQVRWPFSYPWHDVTMRPFPVGASPTRLPLQPEATGAATMETKCLTPSDSRSRHAVTGASVQAATSAGRNRIGCRPARHENERRSDLTTRPSTNGRGTSNISKLIRNVPAVGNGQHPGPSPYHSRPSW